MDRSSHPKIVTIEIVKSTRLELNKDFRGLVFLYYGRKVYFNFQNCYNK